MIDRAAVAVADDQGDLSVFLVAEAQSWESTNLPGGRLYRTNNSNWVMLSEMSDHLGIPGEFLDDSEALKWLTTNGYAPPDELAECARRRLC